MIIHDSVHLRFNENYITSCTANLVDQSWRRILHFFNRFDSVYVFLFIFFLLIRFSLINCFLDMQHFTCDPPREYAL